MVKSDHSTFFRIIQNQEDALRGLSEQKLVKTTRQTTLTKAKRQTAKVKKDNKRLNGIMQTYFAVSQLFLRTKKSNFSYPPEFFYRSAHRMALK
jgi:hypothetical protein